MKSNDDSKSECLFLDDKVDYDRWKFLAEGNMQLVFEYISLPTQSFLHSSASCTLHEIDHKHENSACHLNIHALSEINDSYDNTSFLCDKVLKLPKSSFHSSPACTTNSENHHLASNINKIIKEGQLFEADHHHSHDSSSLSQCNARISSSNPSLMHLESTDHDGNCKSNDDLESNRSGSRPDVARVKEVDADMNMHLRFIEHIIYPWFHPSIHEPHHLCRVSCSMANKLISTIPIDKLRAKLMMDRHHHITTLYHVIGIIERNLSFGKTSFSSAAEAAPSSFKAMISIEIKVKCGLTSISPFVKRCNAIKHRISRYHLMRCYKHRAGDYNPRDIASSSYDRIYRAVHDLIYSSSKQVKINIHGQHVFGWDKDYNSISHLETTLSSFMISSSSSSSSKATSSLSINMLMNIISLVILHESICRDLECLQGIDSIDVEGVYTIFQRLLRYHDNDHTSAVHAIKMKMADPMIHIDKLKSISRYLTMLRDDAISNDHHNTADIKASIHACLSDLIIAKLIEIILSHNLGSTYQQSDSSALDSWVDNLTEADCIDMIKLWLIAMVARDASIIIAVDMVEFDAVGAIAQGCRPILVHRINQTIDTPGIIDVNVNNADHDIDSKMVSKITYSVGLTDICQKDISKIWKKFGLEDDICRFASDHYSM